MFQSPRGRITPFHWGSYKLIQRPLLLLKMAPPQEKKVDVMETQENTKNKLKQVNETEFESTFPPVDDGQRGNKGNEEHISLASDFEGESEERDSDTDNSQVTPIKMTRGRKSKKKQREEKTYLDVLQGSQKTLKGMMNTGSGRKSNRAPKGASIPQVSK